MKIYQVWQEEDRAETDSFFPTKKEAMRVCGQIKKAGGHPIMRERKLERVDREHICRALKFWPMR